MYLTWGKCFHGKICAFNFFKNISKSSRPTKMGRKTRVTKQPISPPLNPLPPTIFSHPLAQYNIPLIKHILSIFRQQSTFRKRESRTSLLQKLVRMELQRTSIERETLSQLLRRGSLITRAAVKAGPQNEDEDGELLEKGEDRECEVCLEVLSAESFRQQLTESKCKHETHICTPCLRKAIIANVETNPWDKIPCPFSGCKNMLKPAMIRKYLQGELLEKYRAFKCLNLQLSWRLISEQL